ncbi:hypothetical protein B0T21DRAFT_196269 [Apiosordaria backusii]|uniref:Uncharacterized protein n=1 Tax=Apiosordaria backusii TaxID=314023 RepID=A0AA40BE20_9PEZI|nr:hypothetical protein B0T21DRAFT_196269 [Apiosordaria backusii]
MSFIKKEEGFVKDEPGGGFDMSKIPMAPPKANTSSKVVKRESKAVKQEPKMTLSALPDHKPAVGQNSDRKSAASRRRKGRYCYFNHIAYSAGNFRMRAVYHKSLQQVKMSISAINPFNPENWIKDQKTVDWLSVEQVIFSKLRRARFEVEAVPADRGKLGEEIKNIIQHHNSSSYGAVVIESGVTFNVRPLSTSGPAIKSEGATPATSWMFASPEDTKPSMTHSHVFNFKREGGSSC